MRGVAAGIANVAARAAASATSTADAGHSASASVDYKGGFWAARSDKTPVFLTIDLGDEQHLESLKIVWEFPAKSFTVSVSGDGEHWTESYATTSNMLRHTSVALAGVAASKVQIKMLEAHPWLGLLQGQSYYAIKAVSVLAPRMHAVLEDCAVAARENDARDKYFAVAVTEHDPAANAGLEQAVATLESAAASLGATLSEISAAIPNLPSCSASAQFSKGGAQSMLSRSTTRLASASRMAGGDVAAVEELLSTAKAAIVELRSSLM